MAKELGAGDLDRRIVIERFTSSQNEFNEAIATTWEVFMEVWANRKDSSDVVATEVLGAEQLGSFLLSHFTIRSSAQAKSVTPVDRIRFDGHIWSIRGTKETAEGRNRFIEISAARANN